RNMRTLEQISQDTGVSVSTISRVLHGRDDVNAGTRERVLEALKRARYSLESKPTRRGRPRIRAKTTKVAVLCKSHAEVRRNPFAAPILVAALEAGGPNSNGTVE